MDLDEVATHDWPWKEEVSEVRAAWLALGLSPSRGVVTAVEAAEVHAMAAIAAMLLATLLVSEQN
jgi:tryptophanyl-tRNA synthetase